MRSYYDDYDDFDDRGYEEFVATRHMIGDRQRKARKKRGHRRSARPKVEFRNDPYWDSDVAYDDYNDNEFDSYYDIHALKYGR